MRQFKVTIGVLGAVSCFITFLLYYWHRTSLSELPMRMKLKIETSTRALEENIMATPMYHMPLDAIYKDANKQDDYSFEMDDHREISVSMIDTPGCQIPVAMVNYQKDVKKNYKSPGTCGRRAVFLKKVDGDKVQVTIKPRIVKNYLRKSAHFDCCYRFLMRSERPGQELKKIRFTHCTILQDAEIITLESDFVNIKCFEYDRRNISHVVYDDVYAFTRNFKPKTTNKTQKQKERKCEAYNVLMIGMDSMSLTRFAQTMSRTIRFFKDNFWMGFRGYHKVGDNTFPNLMAAFTGHNLSTIFEKCSGKMDECNDLLIWNKYKEAGYVTAYGEDYLRLPDTFNNQYAFRKPPTNHYMRPLFLKGETELYNKSLVCAGKVPSGKQLLDYALDFAVTYRNESFFGLFWMNSFSHNINSRPQDADKMFENFFNQLTYTGVLDNTFIIFFSDHGIRFGENRLKVESYYDERMPFLFIWNPFIFKRKRPELYNAAAVNQFRLMTPYDLYNTLVEIRSISECKNFSGSVSKACPQCQSVFSEIGANRTCKDVAIQDKWCSCHKMYPLDIQDSEGIKSVLLVVSHIKSLTKSVKTKRCWGCMTLSLKNIIRIHFYYDKRKINLYHLVAFSMTPGNVSYEATVLKKREKLELVGSVSVISPYRGMGQCTIKPKERLVCVCQKIQNCTN